jgi:hypothetical protein
MTLPKMVNENEATYQGNIFVAVDELLETDKYTAACDLCAFKTLNCMNVNCGKHNRNDNRNVFFKKEA